jgi:hypothetical protein
MIRPTTTKPRRGLAVVAVLLCLLVITLLGAALLKLTLTERESNREHERRLQTEWLVESGMERAVARLSENPAYGGETWQISPAELGFGAAGAPGGGDDSGGKAAALVSVVVDRRDQGKGNVRVHVQADYPRDGPRRARLSQERIIHLEPKKSGATP